MPEKLNSRTTSFGQIVEMPGRDLFRENDGNSFVFINQFYLRKKRRFRDRYKGQNTFLFLNATPYTLRI